MKLFDAATAALDPYAAAIRLVGYSLALAAIGGLIWWAAIHPRLQLAKARSELEVQAAAAASANAAYMASRTRVSELTLANQGWVDTTDVLQRELKTAQEQLVLVRAQGEAAVAAAKRRADEVDRVLATFLSKYSAQAREPTCAQALQTVEAACPAFEGY